MSRIATRFAQLGAANKKAFITYISAGDPDLQTFADILAGLPQAGVDLIEIGVPFSDPVADGPSIERANLRAFAAGITLRKIIAMIEGFRKQDTETPIILMGYANPLYAYGLETFMDDAQRVGIDGLIIADLPPEEDRDIRALAQARDIDIIRLLAPTTDAQRLPILLKEASGFLYYISITGTTGSKQATVDPVRRALNAIRPHTPLPLVVGFGISSPEQARAIAHIADGVIVGSAIVNRIADNLDEKGKAKAGLVNDVLAFVEALAQATHKS